MRLSMLLDAVTDTSVTRTLALALRTIGSLARLAEYLGASEPLVMDWIEGRCDAPTSAYLRALDLVARGPFGSQH
jgi:DNA-binding transcriptional regulator YiaG